MLRGNNGRRSPVRSHGYTPAGGNPEGWARHQRRACGAGEPFALGLPAAPAAAGKRGVIVGYGARREPRQLRLGLQAFVRVQLEKHDQAAIGHFVDSVQGWDEVVACHALTGDMDYLLHVYVRDLEHFSHFLLDRLLTAGGVADANSSFVLRTVKGFQALPLSQLES
ncbi:hypothetical protein G6F22_014559 [Rhizopus arrhizus]|nr:hypothetical protein G6F22_014559 [Rhizopus arrhizus]